MSEGKCLPCHYNCSCFPQERESSCKDRHPCGVDDALQVFYDGKKIHEVVGGNIPELEKIVQDYDKKGGTFQGAAHTLSGGGLVCNTRIGFMHFV